MVVSDVVRICEDRHRAASEEGSRRRTLCAKWPQSHPTPCDPMDCTSPGSSVCGILQAGILEWVGVPFFRGSSQDRD